MNEWVNWVNHMVYNLKITASESSKRRKSWSNYHLISRNIKWTPEHYKAIFKKVLKSRHRGGKSFIHFFSKAGVWCQALYRTPRNQMLRKADVACAMESHTLKCGEKGEKASRSGWLCGNIILLTQWTDLKLQGLKSKENYWLAKT